MRMSNPFKVGDMVVAKDIVDNKHNHFERTVGLAPHKVTWVKPDYVQIDNQSEDWYHYRFELAADPNPFQFRLGQTIHDTRPERSEYSGEIVARIDEGVRRVYKLNTDEPLTRQARHVNEAYAAEGPYVAPEPERPEPKFKDGVASWFGAKMSVRLDNSNNQ